eukprot:jgi/Bigna1/44183/e_gw1.90.10.1
MYVLFQVCATYHIINGHHHITPQRYYVQVEASYDGPTLPLPRTSDPHAPLPKITLEFVLHMVAHFKGRRKLHRKYMWFILTEVLKVLQPLPSLVHVKVLSYRCLNVICGDTHGQFYDLVNIFEINGLPGPENPYLFNGDFVDRGPFSLETVTTLLAFKLLYPEYVHLLRGNHESRVMNNLYGFEAEVKAKYTAMEFDLFEEVFQALPLAAVLEHQVLVVHGGLFTRQNVTLDEIARVDRFREIPDTGIMCELLWSDPKLSIGIGRSLRGVACNFGPDITENFLTRNKLKLLVRSHEVRDEGYSWEHGRRLITVFSAPNYCGMMRNQGAILRFQGQQISSPDIVQFSAVEAPKVAPYFDIKNIMRVCVIIFLRFDMHVALLFNLPWVRSSK